MLVGLIPNPETWCAISVAPFDTPPQTGRPEARAPGKPLRLYPNLSSSACPDRAPLQQAAAGENGPACACARGSIESHFAVGDTSVDTGGEFVKAAILRQSQPRQIYESGLCQTIRHQCQCWV